MTLVWRPGYGGAAVSDPDAQAYLQAVEVADNQALEQGVQQAVNQFVIGCKADGIWDAIKACCILAGARTLSGALVPLVGTAPNNPGNVFVEADYNRETGLKGDGSTKYLDSNRNNNADPQNSQHLVVFLTEQPTINFTLAGAGINSNGSTGLFSSPTGLDYELQSRCRSNAASASNALWSGGTGGISRSSGSNYQEIRGSTIRDVNAASQTPLAGDIFIFGRNNAGSLNNPVNARLAFYSIGESLDLALLDTRVTDLITAIGAAIP